MRSRYELFIRGNGSLEIVDMTLDRSLSEYAGKVSTDIWDLLTPVQRSAIFIPEDDFSVIKVDGVSVIVHLGKGSYIPPGVTYMSSRLSYILGDFLSIPIYHQVVAVPVKGSYLVNPMLTSTTRYQHLNDIFKPNIFLGWTLDRGKPTPPLTRVVDGGILCSDDAVISQEIAGWLYGCTQLKLVINDGPYYGLKVDRRPSICDIPMLMEPNGHYIWRGPPIKDYALLKIDLSNRVPLTSVRLHPHKDE